MSAVVVQAPGPLYASPRGLYGFQDDGIARAYLWLEQAEGMLAVWDTGTGKSHLAMALSALMFEDAIIDHVILVAERQKIAPDEWPADWERFTSLTYARHHGTGRMERLAKKGLPQVLITTYETGKADLARFVKTPRGRGKTMVDGPLLDAYMGKRVLIVFDESTKLKNSGSDLYKVWHRSVNHLRKKAYTKALGMTATPIEKDYEDAFTQLRLLDAKRMPLVKDFEAYFVRSRDPFGRANYYSVRMPEFADMARPMIQVKRKTDPDIINEFPKQVEESRWFDMADDQTDLYERLCDLQPPGEEPVPGLHTIKRMAAGHPMSIVHSARHGQSKLAKMLVEEWGEDYFASVSAVKEKGLLEYLEPVVKGQGAKAVVFSFFGPSMLPLLQTALRRQKYHVYSTYGAMDLNEVAAQRSAFKADPMPAILLSSDAGARGINLPEATYVVEYESALTFANRTQRINRVHRIDSESVSVTCMTFFVSHSIEATLADSMARRNDQHDMLLADDDLGEDYITAAERRVALDIARNPKKRRATK